MTKSRVSSSLGERSAPGCLDVCWWDTRHVCLHGGVLYCYGALHVFGATVHAFVNCCVSGGNVFLFSVRVLFSSVSLRPFKRLLWNGRFRWVINTRSRLMLRVIL